MRRGRLKPRLRGLLCSLALLAGAACGASTVNAAPPAESGAPVSAETAAGLIEQAEAARRKAAELRAEWLETRDLIAQAQKEADLGHLLQAVELAERARRQSELAVAQAEREAEAWQRRVVR